MIPIQSYPFFNKGYSYILGKFPLSTFTINLAVLIDLLKMCGQACLSGDKPMTLTKVIISVCVCLCIVNVNSECVASKWQTAIGFYFDTTIIQFFKRWFFSTFPFWSLLPVKISRFKYLHQHWFQNISESADSNVSLWGPFDEFFERL